MALDPNIQKYFDYKFVEGELHIYIRKEFVEELGWTDQDLEISFGGIRKMNKWGDDVSLSVHKIKSQEYVHPWTEFNGNGKGTKTDRKVL